MPLNAGDVDATQGLAREIFLVLDAQLSPPLAELEADQREQIRDAWRTLSFCVASGVVTHLRRVPAADPEYAETFSSSAQDAAYWGWLAAVAGALRGWAQAGGTLVQLHAALNGAFNANPTPTQLRGVVQ